MHAYKLEDDFQLDIERKTELWAHAERYWLPRLGRSLEPVEAEEVLSILKGNFLRKLRSNEGIGAAIQFSKALFNEAYREFRSDSRRTKRVKEAKCPHCGEVLAKLGRGFECENDLCSMFGVGINGEMLKERTQMISLDEALEAGGDEVLVAWGLSTAADEDVRGYFDGERLDERLVQLLNHPSVTDRDREIVRAYLAEDAPTAVVVAAKMGVSARTVERTIEALKELVANGRLKRSRNVVRRRAVQVAQVEEPIAVTPAEDPVVEAREQQEQVVPVAEPVHHEAAPSLVEWRQKLATNRGRELGRTQQRRESLALRRRRDDPGRARLRYLTPNRTRGEGRCRSSGQMRVGGRCWFS